MLDNLRELTGGNEKRMQLYIDTYLKGIPEAIETIANGIKNGELQKVRTAAHSAKPLLNIMGFERLWEQANELEILIDSDSSTGTVQLQVDALVTGLKESILQLEAL